MKFKYLIIVIALICNIPCLHGDLANIVSAAQRFATWINDLQKIIIPQMDYGEVTPDFKRASKVKLYNHVKGIIGNVEEHKGTIEEGIKYIIKTLEDLPNTIRTEIQINNLANYLSIVDTQYTELEKFMKNKRYNDQTILEFCTYAISHSPDSVLNQVEKVFQYIHSETTGLLESNLIKLFNKKSEEDILILYHQSPQYIYTSLYFAIFLGVVKGEIIIQFAYNFLTLYNKGNFAVERQSANESMHRKTRYIFHQYKNTLRVYKNREFWISDIPASDKRGVTYDEITRLIQGFIQNEDSLNNDKSCMKSCDDYKSTTRRGFDGTSCDRRGCRGKIVDCKFVSKDLRICPSAANTNRRYKFVNSLGGKDRCPTNVCTISQSTYYLFVKCDYCLCLCDESDILSDRYISLQPVFSDYERNKVVTGVRLIKKNRVFHIQIQERKLTSYGKLDGDIKWHSKDFRITDRNIRNEIDYYTLTYNQRTIDLDIVKLLPKYVVTGVKFKFVKGHLKLFVHGTIYEIGTGKLVKDSGKWFSNEHQSENELKLSNPHIPIKDRDSIKTNLRQRNQRSNMYIKFTNSDLHKDVAQTTVPFLDIQEVVSTEGPLQGVGLYHKGNEGFGGFIAPLIVLFDNGHIIEEFLNNFYN